jgi:hypothetical protein
MAPRLTNNIMNDGSRCFLALRPNRNWYAVRDHVSRLQGAKLTEFFNDSPGDYWFFVSDPSRSEHILQTVAGHFVQLLEPESK